MEANNHRIAKNTVFLYGRLLLVLFVSLYVVRIILNALGTVDYGVYDVVGGFVSMFGFLNTSMSNATQRFYNFEIGLNGNQASVKVFNTALRTQLIMAAALFILAELVGVWYLNNVMEIPPDRMNVANWLLQFSIMTLMLTIVQIPFSAALIAYERLDFYAIVGIIDVVLKLMIAFLIKAYNGDRLLMYGGLLLGIAITNFLLYIGYIRKNFPWLKVSSAQFSRSFQKKMLSFTGWNFIGTFSFMLRGQGVNLLLNYFFGVAINAANGIATQISSALQQFSTNLILAFKPQLVQSYASSDLKRTTAMFFMMSKTAFALLIMLACPIILNIDFILKIWLGKTIPDYTSIFAILTVISVAINCLHTPVVQVIHAVGNIRAFSTATCLVISSIIPISWIALKCGGGPAVCYIISIIIFILNQICALVLLKRIYPIKYSQYLKTVILQCIIFAALVSAVTYASTLLISDNFIKLIVVSCTSFVASIIGFSFIMLTKSDRLIAFNAITNKLKHK